MISAIIINCIINDIILIIEDIKIIINDIVIIIIDIILINYMMIILNDIIKTHTMLSSKGKHDRGTRNKTQTMNLICKQTHFIAL